MISSIPTSSVVARKEVTPVIEKIKKAINENVYCDGSTVEFIQRYTKHCNDEIFVLSTTEIEGPSSIIGTLSINDSKTTVFGNFKNGSSQYLKKYKNTEINEIAKEILKLESIAIEWCMMDEDLED